MYIAFAFAAILIVMMIICRKENIPDSIEYSKITAPAYKVAEFIYRVLVEKKEYQSRYYQKLFSAKSTLHPAGKTREEVEIFLVEKTGKCLLVLFVGMLFIGLGGLSNSSNEYLEDDYRIKRQDYDRNGYEVILNAEADGELIEDYEINIDERKYTDEQLDEMLPQAYEAFDSIFLANNESADFVNSEVCMPDELPDYPFKLEYFWEEKDVITRDGTIGENVSESGTIVLMEVLFKYEQYSSLYEFAINVFPPEITKAEHIRQMIDDALEQNNLETKTQEYLSLPMQIDGISVVWSEQKKNNTVIFILLILVSTVVLFFGFDKDLFSQIEKRNAQMMDDYPEIVGKLTLLVGAGMTVRGAWKKIAMDYKEKRDREGMHRYAYEEMLYSVYEMESGTEETICYNHFSQRVGVQKYVKLVSLLDQNLKMGSKGLIINLQHESEDAFEERKSTAEKKGEEVGTKLLLPMVMMLAVVMVIIMVPAFMSM